MDEQVINQPSPEVTAEIKRKAQQMYLAIKSLKYLVSLIFLHQRLPVGKTEKSGTILRLSVGWNWHLRQD